MYERPNRPTSSSAAHPGSPPSRALPLLTAQSGIYYAHQLAPLGTELNTADRVEIDGPLDGDLFTEALGRAVGEAETLAVRLTEADGTPVQHVTRTELRLHRLELTEEQAVAWMREDLARPVDLASADGLMTQALIRVGEGRHWWYQRVHHIAVDAYALSLIGRRVAELYSAAVAEEPAPEGRFAPLSELTDAEAAYLSGEEYAEDRAFWAERMAGYSPRPHPPRPMPLPVADSCTASPTSPRAPWTGSPGRRAPRRRPGPSSSSPRPPVICTGSRARRTWCWACPCPTGAARPPCAPPP